MILLFQTSGQEGGFVGKVNVTLDGSWHQFRALRRQGCLTQACLPYTPCTSFISPQAAPACTRGEKKQRLFWVLLAQQQPPRNTMVSDPPQVDTDPMQ